jgi:hypothetical protein
MVWIFVVGGLSIWDDLDGVTERRATLPGPVAVLNDFMEGKWGKERRRVPPTQIRRPKSPTASPEWQRTSIQAPLKVQSPIPRLHNNQQQD